MRSFFKDFLFKSYTNGNFIILMRIRLKFANLLFSFLNTLLELLYNIQIICIKPSKLNNEINSCTIS